MLKITRRLKRVNIVWWMLSLPLFIITLPIYLLARFGELCETIMSYMVNFRNGIMGYYVKIFNFNEIARKQYAENPDKFKFK